MAILNRILFVGNSLTFQHAFHDVPGALARTWIPKKGTSLICDRLTRDGACLNDYITSKELSNALSTARYDAVLFQEYSTLAVDDPPQFLSAAAAACREAERRASLPILVCPWLPRDDTRWDEHFARYEDVRQRLGIPVTWVGRDWRTAILGGAALYAPDGSHANPTGTDITVRAILNFLSSLK